MTYFDPSQDITTIFVDEEKLSCFFLTEPNCYPNLDLTLDLNFSNEQFSFDLEDGIEDKTTHLEETKTISSNSHKNKRISKPRYEKNICGYILKKILRGFISTSYRSNVSKACLATSASFEDLQKFCLDRIEKLNGISSPHSFFMPANKQEIGNRQALIEFTEWFLEERYVRHIIVQGKMANKQKYINFKNTFFRQEMKRLKNSIRDMKNSFNK